MKSLLFVVNVDWFFLSHRLPIALTAQQKGYTVTLVAADTGKKAEIEKWGIRVIPIPFERSGTNPLHELTCIVALFKLYRRERPDVIHHVTLKASLLGALAAKLSGARNVVNAISGLGYNFTNGRRGFVQWMVRRMVEMAFRSKYFRFILQNPDDVEMIANLHLVPPQNCYLIKGSGVDLTQFAFTPTPGQATVRFLFPARILEDKGIYELIEAAALLKDRYREQAEFVLAGDCDMDNPTGIHKEKLLSMLDGNYIRWIGYRSDMLPVYQQASVVVLPSYREGLPKALIEACAIGRAIITTDVPGCRECVQNQYNGLLVPAKNAGALAAACRYFIENREAISTYGSHSRKKAEAEFGIDRVVEKTLSIYKDILSASRK